MVDGRRSLDPAAIKLLRVSDSGRGAPRPFGAAGLTSLGPSRAYIRRGPQAARALAQLRVTSQPGPSDGQ